MDKYTEGRIVSFDYLRVFAAYAVMLLHVSAQNWGKCDVTSTPWLIFNAYNSISRWGVSVFVMISGALFLDRDIPFSRMLKKYIPRLVTAYVFWSVIYFLLTGKGITAKLAGLFGNSTASSVAALIRAPGHLWYLPLCCGLYLCTPLLRPIAKNESLEKLFLTLALLFSFIFPTIVTLMKDFGGENIVKIAKAFDSVLGNFGMQLVAGFSAFYVLGHFLTKTELSKKTRLFIYAAGLCGFAATILLNAAVSIKNGKPVENYYYAFTINVMLEAVSVFLLCKSLFSSPGKCYPFIRKLSEWSFGAYLIHVLILTFFKDKAGFGTFSFHPALSVPVITVIVFILSFGISAILNQIPRIRRYII